MVDGGEREREGGGGEGGREIVCESVGVGERNRKRGGREGVFESVRGRDKKREVRERERGGEREGGYK
jgi:hypothetical protein